MEITVDALAPLEPPPDLGVSRPVVPPRDEAAIDRLDLVGHLRPGPGLVARPGRGPQLVAERGVAGEPFELRRQGERVAERKEQAPLPLADQLAIELEIRGDRDGAGGESLPNQARGGPDTGGGEAGDVRAGEELRGL